MNVSESMGDSLLNIRQGTYEENVARYTEEGKETHDR